MSHFEERMETDLKVIRDRLWKIGEDVEQALRQAKKVLILQDKDLAYSTILGDFPINRDSRECDRLCHTFIARHLPGAGHLRELASTTRVNVTLERIGDHAVTICREALQLTSPIPGLISNRLDALFDEAISILADSRRSFRDANVDMAITLMQVSKRMEGEMDTIYELLFAEDSHLDGPTLMGVFVVFNMLKRITGQARNICDQTVYTVKGIAKIPKTYRILFLDQPGSDAAQLATAIGRKNFPESGHFVAAIPGVSQPVSESLNEFLTERSLPDEDLETEQVEVIEHDLADFTVIVSLKGRVSDYIDKVPFHTSALRWATQEGNDPLQQYRALREQIHQLMTLLAGDTAD